LLGKIILLVEDNPDHQDLVQRALRKEGVPHLCVGVKDVDEAMDFVHARGAWEDRDRKLTPALVLVDLKLAKSHGHEVLRTLRKDSLTKHIPAVVLTSSVEERDVAASYEAGANGYVRKEIDFDEFGRALRAVASYWLDVNVAPEVVLKGR
jgi:two-component system response regulator